jgi:capping protein (actin filament) muscle Z-line, alpha
MVGAAALSDSEVMGARDSHARGSWPVVRLADGSRVVLCEDGYVSPGHFVDSKSLKQVSVDLVTGEVDEAGSGAPAPAGFSGEDGSAVEALRAELVGAAREYAAEVFSHRGVVHGGAEVFVKDGASVVVVLSGVVARLDNFWAGQWRSRWVLASGTLSGRMDVMTHYFEDGNVQMRTSKRVEDLKVTDAADCLSKIREAEGEYYRNIAGLLAGAQEELLKDLRRQLPVTGVTMQWDMGAHRVRRALHAKSGATTSA